MGCASRAAGSALLAGLTLSQVPAHADDAAGAAPAPAALAAPAPAAMRVWYGGQTLFADLASFGAVALGASIAHSAAVSAGVIGGLGIVGYAVGGPIVHARRDHTGKALGSAALRLTLPVTGALVGSAIFNAQFGRATCNPVDCGLRAIVNARIGRW